ncbi:flavin reductase family protein [Rhodococcus sp. IEGM 1379]|uniref:flavin reductase family protein n=1 Tax=Rhodococcus sp. IEGM 1379 TaxID=3047086 RepID=UPI0024B70577|nr:flavin reductase family protein [Rhodococcus sp. IEGM 1379]MDI9913749.1 flavin reductase family protein [Rhodococcus sp. IEGM 1379]
MQVPDENPRQADSGAFDKIVGLLDYPMFVVTTCVGGQQAGCLVGFASQISITPQRFLVGLSKNNRTYRTALDSEYLAVQLLPRRRGDIATLFGESTGDDIDKFAHCTWLRGPHELPILEYAAAWFSGRIIDKIDMGDHVAFILEPETGSAPEELDDVITYSDVRGLEPGHRA